MKKHTAIDPGLVIRPGRTQTIAEGTREELIAEGICKPEHFPEGCKRINDGNGRACSTDGGFGA